MSQDRVSRRNFSKLSVAAFGGLFAGAAGPAARADHHEDDEDAKVVVDPAILLEEPNVCRGLNTCADKGRGNHECAGMGSCATVEAHSCAGTNDCKGQGGCGGYPGQNTCEGKGHCAVPLKDSVWEIARKQFEHLHKDMDKKVGSAPSA